MVILLPVFGNTAASVILLPVFASVFNVRTAANACDCMYTGGYTDTVRECALEADSEKKKEKNPLPHRGLEPASVLCLAFHWDALPTELLPPFALFPAEHSWRHPAHMQNNQRSFEHIFKIYI